jgi:sugar/nucleoside kinase (ribokinase family)
MMKKNHTLGKLSTIEYLVIGHITKDLIPGGSIPGGTSSYAALTANHIGLRTGIVTAHAGDIDLTWLDGIQIAAKSSPQTTTFENRYTNEGRIQTHLAQALDLSLEDVPSQWREPGIVHIGPVAGEIDVHLVETFPNSFVGVTPQGFMRSWDSTGLVYAIHWENAEQILKKASAVVLSVEDVHNDESQIDWMASRAKVLVITEGANGARVYWNGDLRSFRAPHVEESDPTGAGDIFAAGFFIRMAQTNNPWEAARYANCIAARSVTRHGLDSVPTIEESKAALVEIIR